MKHGRNRIFRSPHNSVLYAIGRNARGRSWKSVRRGSLRCLGAKPRALEWKCFDPIAHAAVVEHAIEIGRHRKGTTDHSPATDLLINGIVIRRVEFAMPAYFNGMLY